MTTPMEFAAIRDRYDKAKSGEGLAEAIRKWDRIAKDYASAVGQRGPETKQAMLNALPLPSTIDEVRAAQANAVAALIRDLGDLIDDRDRLNRWMAQQP